MACQSKCNIGLLIIIVALTFFNSRQSKIIEGYLMSEQSRINQNDNIKTSKLMIPCHQIMSI